MEIKKVFVEGETEPCLWQCGHCKTYYKSQEYAEMCCVPIICSECGKEISQDLTKGCRECVYGTKEKPLCFSCYDTKRRAAEEIWSEETYIQKNKETDNKYSYVVVGDDFYTDLFDAVQNLWDDGYTKEEIKDTYFYVCETSPIEKINIDRVLENLEENMDIIDFDRQCSWNCLQELYDFIDEWNKKQTYTYWTQTNIQVEPSQATLDEYCT